MQNRLLPLFIAFVFFSGLAQAQFDAFHPELKWKTIKTEHLEVHYHEGAERTARLVAKIGEDVWGPITSLYQYEPTTIHYVIKDIDDYSNGATYFFDNKIEIWTSALDFDLRGTHNWLRNVISHEFTHMVQIQKSMKISRGVPAIYLQWLNYEDKRRPDILYGFPNIITSYPLASINMPAWFAEGTAQYMRKEFDYDNWDSHRDMILRSYALDNNMLTWNQMGVFGKTSLGNESVYNSGFALTSYLAQKYGEDKLRTVTAKLGKFSNFTIDAAFEDVLGKDGDEIYDEWTSFVKADYLKRTASIRNNLITGDKVREEGFGNFHPQFIAHGKEILYLSNKGSDYLSLTSLFRYNSETKTDELLIPGVRSSFSLLPDQNRIIYSKLSDDNPHRYNVHDIFVYNIAEKDETRLTNNLRANQPSLSPDGTSVVFIFQKDGTTNIGTIAADGSGFKQLTFFQDGEQVYNPKYSPDGKTIYFDYSYHHGRDIYSVKADGSGMKPVFQEKYDERNPSFDVDGNLLYASDETGIFNIYRMNLATGEKQRLTNVLGGAFMPSASQTGDIVYAGYTSGGYKIFVLRKDQQNTPVTGSYLVTANPPLGEDTPNGDIQNFPVNELRNFQDRKIGEYPADDYRGSFTSLSVFPFIRFDNYSTSNNALEKIKPGIYIASNDMLSRYSLFAGGSINTRWERDLFLLFEYRNKLPLLFDLGLIPRLSLELYNISRKADVDILFDEYPAIKTGVGYDLLEANLVANHTLLTRSDDLELRLTYSRYVSTLESFLLPNNNTLYPTTTDEYLRGWKLGMKYEIAHKTPYRDDDINPLGSKLEFKAEYEWNDFNNEGEYEVVDGILKPQYNKFNFLRLELNTWLSVPTFERHTLNIRLRGATILGPQMPDFFDNYLGGFVGMRSYPFYSVSGNDLVWMNIAYRFPLFRDIDARLGHLYFDKIFFTLYGDVGNAWNYDVNGFDNFKLKKGIGAEIRIAMNSFYLFPTNLFFSVAYGFDKLERVIRKERVVYGQEFSFYAGLLFGFDFFIDE